MDISLVCKSLDKNIFQVQTLSQRIFEKKKEFSHLPHAEWSFNVPPNISRVSQPNTVAASCWTSEVARELILELYKTTEQNIKLLRRARLL